MSHDTCMRAASVPRCWQHTATHVHTRTQPHTHRLQERINAFKSAHNWDSHTWVGVHIRRRDHATQPFFQEHWKKHNVSLNVKIDKHIEGNFKELPYPYWWQVRWCATC